MQERKLPTHQLIPFLLELIESGRRVRLLVTGCSMYPFLRHGLDSVELCAMDSRFIKVGSILLIEREPGDYALHRVCRVEGSDVFIVGDNQMYVEGPYGPELQKAAVDAIWRNDRRYPTESGAMRWLPFLWLQLKPFRLFLLKIIRRVIPKGSECLP